jgi:hypothetical protein
MCICRCLFDVVTLVHGYKEDKKFMYYTLQNKQLIYLKGIINKQQSRDKPVENLVRI